MCEYWANVYIMDGKTDIGLERETRQECEQVLIDLMFAGNLFPFVKASYRIHVKLKG